MQREKMVDANLREGIVEVAFEHRIERSVISCMPYGVSVKLLGYAFSRLRRDSDVIWKTISEDSRIG